MEATITVNFPMGKKKGGLGCSPRKILRHAHFKIEERNIFTHSFNALPCILLVNSRFNVHSTCRMHGEYLRKSIKGTYSSKLTR